MTVFAYPLLYDCIEKGKALLWRGFGSDQSGPETSPTRWTAERW